MGDVINLREARKKRERRDKDAKAAVNRIAFGRSKAEKALTEAEEAMKRRLLDGKQLDDPDTPL